MANPSLDRLEQQLGKLVTICEVLMKNMGKNNEKMKADNAKLYALTAKYDDCSADNNDEFNFSKQPQMVLPPYPTPLLDSQPTEDVHNLIKLISSSRSYPANPSSISKRKFTLQPTEIADQDQETRLPEQPRVPAQSHLQISNPPPNKPISHRKNSSALLATKALPCDP